MSVTNILPDEEIAIKEGEKTLFFGKASEALKSYQDYYNVCKDFMGIQAASKLLEMRVIVKVVQDEPKDQVVEGAQQKRKRPRINKLPVYYEKKEDC